MNNEDIDITQFLLLIIETLKAAGIDYLVGGAIAAWAWGEPRSTQDVDLVIDIPIEAIGKFSEELKARGMLVPADIILDNLLEVRADVPINAIHMYSGLKADLYPIREGDELRRSAFQRRIEIDFGPPIGNIFIHSPEDLILYKLIYYNKSHQLKHTRDISAIIQSRRDQLDRIYLQAWIDRLGLGGAWGELLDAIDAEN